MADGGRTSPSKSKKKRSKDGESKSTTQDFEPYLSIPLDNKELLKQLEWKYKKKKGWTYPFDILNNCRIELAEENGLKSARITWSKQSPCEYEISCNPKLPAEIEECQGEQEQIYVLRQLLLNKKYLVSIACTTRKMTSTILFHTGPRAPSNFTSDGNSLTWDKADGAAKYHVKITNPNSDPEEHTTTDNKVTITNSSILCGMDAKVTITAMDTSGRQKTSREQTVFFADMKAPRDTRAKLNSDDPCRSIDVDWSEPQQGQPDIYKVRILTRDGKHHYDEESTTSTTHTFRNLISNCTFYAEVSAVWENICHVHRSSSVETKFKQRNKIDISDLGKAYNVSTNLVDEGEYQKCDVRWKLPELGGESVNFACQKVSATAIDLTLPNTGITSSCTEDSGSFHLEWGKKYNIVITASYKDFDTLQLKDAVMETAIETDRRVHPNCQLENNPTRENEERAETSYISNVDSDAALRTAKGHVEAPSKIRAKLNCEDPCRSIDVEWSEPQQGQPDIYKLRLLTTEDKQYYNEESTTSTTHTFHDLMSNQAFYVEVSAVWGTLCHTERSSVVTTQLTERNEIDILDFGKAYDITASLVDEGVKQRCDVKWKLPKLGGEISSYVRYKVSAKAVDSLNQDICLPSSCTNDTSGSFPLEWGKKYGITITCSYKDLDTLQQKDAVGEKSVETDFECPNEIKTEIGSKSLEASWNRAKGVKFYQVRVYNEEGTLCEDSSTISASHTSHEFEIGTKLLSGQYYKIEVTSFDFAGRTKTSTPKRLFVGGDDVPQGAQISLNVANPNRSLEFNWEEPVAGASSYECAIFCSAVEQSAVQTKDICERKAIFHGLKQNTEYFGKIRSIKTGGKQGPWCQTVVRRTHFGRKKMSSEEITSYGRVSQLSLDSSRSSDGNIILSVVWKNPAAKDMLVEDYDLTGFDLVCKINGDEEVVGVEKHIPYKENFRYKEFVEVTPGKPYSVFVSAIYADIDNGEKFRVDSKETIYAEVAAPHLTIQHGTRTMELSWKKTPGVEKYKVRIVDATHSEIVFEADGGKSSKSVTYDEKVRIGRLCEFTLIAVDSCGKEVESESKREIVGGEHLLHSLRLTKVERFPRRLKLTWVNIGEYKPDIEEVSLYEAPGCKTLQPIEKTDTSAEFRYLKSSTEYYAVIQVKTTAGRIPFRSNAVITGCVDPSLSKRNNKLPRKIWVSKSESGEAYLNWQDVELEEETTGYQVTIIQVGGWFGGQKEILKETVSGTSVGLTGLNANEKFKSTVEPIIWNSDEEKKIVLSGNSHEFYKCIDPPKLHDPQYKGNSVFFEWDAIAAADEYELEILDASTYNKIHEERIQKRNSVSIKLQGEVRMGRSCEIRLTAIVSKSEKVKARKNWIIGGDKVPRDVTISKNGGNPRRCLDIRFTEPKCKEQPEKYVISACPSSGSEKTCETDKTEFTFENLRRNTTYHFKIQAVYQNMTSEASVSASESTDSSSGSDDMPSTTAFRDVDKAELNIQNSEISSTYVASQKDDDAVVQSVSFTDHDDSHEKKDTLKFTWEAPSFSNNSENFVVENYLWKVTEENGALLKSGETLPVDGQHNYTTEEIDLDLGKSYKFQIKTKYENIDEDKTHKISHPYEMVLHTRPCKPSRVFCSVVDTNKLLVSWNAADGAEEYKIELYSGDDSDPHRVARRGKQETSFAWDISKDIEFGMEFYAVVTAIGSEKKEHSAKSKKEVLGGDRMPKSARAATDPESPTTSAIVQWAPPVAPPTGYEVHAISPYDVKKRECDGSDECRIKFKDLQPGTKYFFKVFANHAGQMTIGCPTNKLITTTAPGKVKIIRAKPDKANDSNAVYVQWESQEECSDYKVVLRYDDNKSFQSIHTRKTEITVGGLIPRTKYTITVTGGTGDDTSFGNESDPITVTTALGRPRLVIMRQGAKNPESEMDVSFVESGEPDISYLACLSDNVKVVQQKTSPTSPIKFTDLLPNTQYLATVQVKYKDSEGDKVTSNKLSTAPLPPTNFSAEAIKDNEITSSTVKLKWEADSKCREHKVNVMRANTQEAELIVKGKNECEYRCLDETCDYTFTVQTKNSDIFSGKSREKRIKFPPARIENVLAHLRDETGELEVTWEKAGNKAQSYRITTIANGHAIDSKTLTTTHYKIPPDNKSYKDYAFTVYPLDELQQSPRGTTSNVVKLRPPAVKLKHVKPNPMSPTTSIIMRWEELQISDIEYELQISLVGEHEIGQEQVLIVTRRNGEVCNGVHSYVYQCPSPGSRYKVSIGSRRDGVPGKRSKAIDCQLAPQPPSEVVVVKKNEGEGPKIDISVKCDGTKPDYFIFCVKDWSGKNVKGPSKSEIETFSIEGLCYGMIYDLSVQSVFANIKDFPSNEATQRIQMAPEKVGKIHFEDGNGTVVAFWPELNLKPEHYVVTWAWKPEEYQQVKVNCPRFEIPTQGIGESIRIRVAGENSGGIGLQSDEVLHKTDPSPPYDIRVYLGKNEPETCLIVEYRDDACHTNKKYAIYLDEEKIGETSELRYDVKDLIPGSSYNVSVASTVGDKESTRRQAQEAITTAPFVVKEVTARLCKTSFGERSMIVTWPSVGKFVEEYEVTVYSLHEDDQVEILKKQTEKTCCVSGELINIEVPTLPAGKSCSCEVAAVHKNARGKVTSSNRIFVGWDRPKKFSVSLDKSKPSRRALIEWTKPPFVESFELSITDSTGKEMKKMLTDVEYLFQNGTPGESYIARLRWGSKKTFEPCDPLQYKYTLAPSPPDKVSATCKNDQGRPTLEVSIKSERLQPDFYIVELKELTTGKIVKGPWKSEEENFVIDGGLHHGQAYVVTASSVLKVVQKYPSERMMSDVVTTAPEQVGGISIKEENGLLVINWPESKTKVDHYVVYWANGSDEYEQRKVRGTKFENPTLGVGETFSVRVAAVNGGVEGLPSEETSYKTIPSSPTNPQLEVSKTEPETSLLFTYSDDACDPRKRYRVYVNDKKVVETNDLQYKISGLIPGSANKISVTSIVENRESEHCFTTEPGVTVPGKVDNITGLLTSDGRVVMTWKHPNDIAPEKYKIKWKLNDDEEKEDIVYIPEFRSNRLEKDAKYQIRVAPVNSSGEGKWSDFARSWTGPQAPRNVTANVEVDDEGNRYMDVRFDDEIDLEKKYYIMVMDDRHRKKLYITDKLSTTIRNFGDLHDARSFTVGVYSMKGNVRSSVSRATERSDCSSIGKRM